jgi:hypothetical protein
MGPTGSLSLQLRSLTRRERARQDIQIAKISLASGMIYIGGTALYVAVAD